jgi:radical SAM protein with 4Fe4S-binding SPASM domain
MIRTSSIGPGAALRYARRISVHPWIASKLVALEVEKRLFNLLHPKHGAGLAGKIRQASFRLTDRCNLRCHTCGQWGDNGYLLDRSLKELKEREVPTQRYLDVLADLAENGHRPLVYFWGGEPMLYPGILDLIEGSARLGLPSSIATNGTRLAASARRLVEAPLFLLQVSIDGHSADLHNGLRPAAGGGGNNFNDIIEGLDAVREVRAALGSGLPFIAALTVISQANMRHLNDIYEVFRDKVDLFVFYLSWWIDKDSAEAHERDFARRFGFYPTLHRGWIGEWKLSDPQELDQQLQNVLKKSSAWSSPAVALVPPILGGESLKTYYTDHGATFGYDKCVSIFQAVEVNNNGDVSPCRDYHDYVVGNIKDSTITELWNSPRYQKFRRSISGDGLMPVCTRCCGLMGY